MTDPELGSIRGEVGDDPTTRRSTSGSTCSVKGYPSRSAGMSTGTKRIDHPVVGEITLAFETLVLPSSSGIVIATYLTEPGSSSADAVDMLRRWTALPLASTSDARS